MSKGQMKNGASIVIEKLIEMGVTTVFGYPGGAVIPLYHEWVKYEKEIKHYRASHEQHAVHAADGYGRATGKVGVCLVTSGPGATNTVTGIATAFMDSIPMVIISGQVPTQLIGKDAFQEVDITSMTLAVTKSNFLVRSIEELEECLEKAFHIAQSGRPGPVLIDIPKDILLGTIEVSSINKGPSLNRHLNKSSNKSALYEKGEDGLQSMNTEVLAQWINTAKRPLIYCGGGVKSSGAEAELLQMAEKMNSPVIHSFMGIGNIDRDHPLSIGMAGMHGSRAANEAIQNCDLILAIGVRFSDRVVGNPKTFCIQGKMVHIDLDPTEHEKNLKVDMTVEGDIKTVLSELLPLIEESRHRREEKCSQTEEKDHEKWIKDLKQMEKAYPQSEQVQWIYDAINEADDRNTIYCTDVGQHQMWSAQKLRVHGSRDWISSGGLGTMGFGLGAAIGARIGQRHKRVVLITGDGSFRMNMAELSTLMDYDLKVDIILFDNRALGMVRQWQALFQDHVYSETAIKGGLDFNLLAGAFGFKTYQAHNSETLKQALVEGKNNPKSTLTIVALTHDEQVLPIVPPGKGLEEAIYK